MDRLEEGNEEHDALRETGQVVSDRADSLLVEFNGPSDLQGFIQTPSTVSSMLGAAGSLGSSWDLPTESQMTYLAQGEARLQQALALVAAFFDDDYAAFRSEAAALQLDIAKAIESPSMSWRPER